MNKLFSFLIASCFLGIFGAAEASEREVWPFIVNGIGEGEVFVNQWMFEYDNLFIKLGESSNNESAWLKTLRSYYEALSLSNTANIESLLSELDGSKEFYLNFVKKCPDCNDNYSRLEKVRIISEQRWGAYRHFRIELLGKGRAMEWKVTLLCVDDCKVSKIFEIDEEAERFLNVHLSIQYDFNKKTGTKTNSKNIDFNNGDWLTFSVEPPVSTDGVQEPIVFHILLNKFTGMILNRESCNSLSRVSKVICDFQNVVREITSSVNNVGGYSLQSYIKGDIDKWGGERDTIWPFVNILKNSVSGSKKIVRKRYAEQAFIQYLNNWKAIRVVGSVSSKYSKYLFILPILENDATAPFQLVMVDENAPNNSRDKLVFGHNFEDQYDLFYNSYFSNPFYDELKELSVE